MNDLPKDNRCMHCGEWFHNAHCCPVLNRRAQPEPAAPSITGIGTDKPRDVFPTSYSPEVAAHADGFLAARPAAPSVAPEPPTRETLAEIVRSHLTSTYHCVRVWEAWHVGTMTEDDFEPASESDMAEDIADAILAANPPRAPLTEGALMGIYMEFDRHADKAWTPAEYLLRFAAAVDAHGIGGK